MDKIFAAFRGVSRRFVAACGGIQFKLPMKSPFKAFSLAIAALALALPVRAADESFVGKWKGQFDSQIGVQKYTFEFKLDSGKLAGIAIGEREMGTNEVKITEGKITKDEIFFVELLTFGDQEIRIEYKGKLTDEGIKFHRKVADIAEEDFVAKRVKEEAKAEAKPEVKAGTNSAAAKP
jgi:hypothetical protein